MKPFTTEEDDKVRIMYERGETYAEIAKKLDRSRSGVEKRYKALLKWYKNRLDDDIAGDVRYVDPAEPNGEISAKDWALQQKVRVDATWKRQGLPPSSLYSDLPSWPESEAESSGNLASNETAKSTKEPLAQLPSSSSVDKESIIEEPKPISKEPKSIAEEPKSVAQKPKSIAQKPMSIAEEPKSSDHERLIEQVQTAHKSVLRALKSSEAQVAEQKSLTEYYKSQAGHQDGHVKETEAEQGLGELRILVDHYKAQAEQHKRRVEEVEGEKRKLLEEVHQFDRQNAAYETRLDGMGAEVIEAITLLSNGEVDKAIDLLTGTKRRRIE